MRVKPETTAEAEAGYAPTSPDFHRHIGDFQQLLADTNALSPLQVMLLHDGARLLRYFTTVLELLNEAMDVLFLPQLWDTDPVLFWISLGFLVFTVLVRISVCAGFVPRLKAGRLAAFTKGALIYTLEPNAGMSYIEPLLETQSRGASVDERTILTHELDRATALATLKSTFAMVLFEDLPELAVEVAFVVKTKGSASAAGPIFLLSATTTLMHLCRQLYEIRSLLAFLPANKALDEAAQLCNQSHKAVARHKLASAQLIAVADEVGKGVWEQFSAEGRTDLSPESIVRAARAGGARLTKLSLFGCPHVPSEGVAQIAEACPALKEAFLIRTGVRDAAIASLARNCGRNLTTLGLGVCPELTQASLFSLVGKVPNLQFLALIMNQWVEDEAVVALVKTTPALNFVALTGTRCTDETLFALAAWCPKLAKVGVVTETTTDAGILALARGCPALTVLCTKRGPGGWTWGGDCVHVTEEGRRAAEKARPGLFPDVAGHPAGAGGALLRRGSSRAVSGRAGD